VGADQIVADAQEIVEELFADAVAVGALSLPSSHDVNDFGIVIEGGVTYMFRNDKPGIRAALLVPSQYLYPNVLMDSPNIYAYLENFQDSVDTLVDEPRRARAS
jgi:hypothetical protein